MASTQEMQRRAKLRKAAEDLAKQAASGVINIKVTPDMSGQGQQDIGFKDFLAIAAKYGWTKKYEAPDNNAMGNEILALARKCNHKKLHAELAKHDGFDYKGGVADLVGGALLRASNPMIDLMMKAMFS